jgi:phage terminase large subunit
LLYNPRLVSDFVETLQESAENGILVRHINYTENPFISQTMLRKIDRLKRLDYEEYEHIYLGLAKSDDDNVVIKRSWIEASIDAHLKLGIAVQGDKRIGFDIADDGKDLCAQIYRHGIVALWGEHWKGKEDEILKSCTRVYNKAIELGADVDYDSIGVGASAGNKFSDLNSERKEQGLAGKVNYRKFVAGAKVINPDGLYIDAEDESVTNKDFFANLKSQAWWTVADRFRNTYNAVVNGETFDTDELISISSGMPNLANLVTELSTPRRDFAKDGRVKVESKDDLARREVKSPNDADGFIMAYAPIEDDGFSDMLRLALAANG